MDTKVYESVRVRIAELEARQRALKFGINHPVYTLIPGPHNTQPLCLSSSEAAQIRGTAESMEDFYGRAQAIMQREQAANRRVLYLLHTVLDFCRGRPFKPSRVALAPGEIFAIAQLCCALIGYRSAGAFDEIRCVALPKWFEARGRNSVYVGRHHMAFGRAATKHWDLLRIRRERPC